MIRQRRGATPARNPDAPKNGATSATTMDIQNQLPLSLDLGHAAAIAPAPQPIANWLVIDEPEPPADDDKKIVNVDHHQLVFVPRGDGWVCEQTDDRAVDMGADGYSLMIGGPTNKKHVISYTMQIIAGLFGRPSKPHRGKIDAPVWPAKHWRVAIKPTR